jgi:hypothetical protein
VSATASVCLFVLYQRLFQAGQTSLVESGRIKCFGAKQNVLEIMFFFYFSTPVKTIGSFQMKIKDKKETVFNKFRKINLRSTLALLGGGEP